MPSPTFTFGMRCLIASTSGSSHLADRDEERHRHAALTARGAVGRRARDAAYLQSVHYWTGPADQHSLDVQDSGVIFRLTVSVGGTSLANSVSCMRPPDYFEGVTSFSP